MNITSTGFIVFISAIIALMFFLSLTFPEIKNNPIRMIGYLWYSGQFDAIHKDIEKQVEKKYKEAIDKSVDNITKEK